MYWHASARVLTPLSPMNRRNAASFNSSRMNAASLKSSWRSANRAVRMTFASPAGACGALRLIVRGIAPLVVERRQQVGDFPGILANGVAQALHHALPIGGGMVLAELPFARQTDDRELESDDQRQHF